jgi:hypothetical protein
MFGKKIILAATALAALTMAGAGAAGAAPWNHHRTVVVREVHRPYVARARVYETLRLHRYVGLGDPYFLHGRYVVRSHDRFGRTVLVQVDPWTGRYVGVVRL